MAQAAPPWFVYVPSTKTFVQSGGACGGYLLDERRRPNTLPGASEVAREMASVDRAATRRAVCQRRREVLDCILRAETTWDAPLKATPHPRARRDIDGRTFGHRLGPQSYMAQSPPPWAASAAYIVVSRSQRWAASAS